MFSSVNSICIRFPQYLLSLFKNWCGSCVGNIIKADELFATRFEKKKKVDIWLHFEMWLCQLAVNSVLVNHYQYVQLTVSSVLVNHKQYVCNIE